MGQKVHPTGFRVGIKIKAPGQKVEGTSNVIDWSSRWYAKKKQFGEFLIEDQKIREFIKWGNSRRPIHTKCQSRDTGKERRGVNFAGFYYAGIPKIEIERKSGVDNTVDVKIHIARPGLIIGRRGKKIELLTADLEAITGKKVNISIVEVKNPDACAQLVAENIAEQLEKRASFRRVMKRSVEAALNAGVKGVKIQVAGRLGGAEMARTEAISRGKIPLQTLRAMIDYGFAIAKTIYGTIGVKVWFYKGDVIVSEEERHVTTQAT